MKLWSLSLAVLFSFLTLTTLLPARAELSSWGYDQDHCKAIFVVTHAGLAPVTGWFKKIRGRVEFDSANLKNSRVKAKIETESLDSGSHFRDFHLKSEHFFDIKNFSVISFESTEIKPLGPGKFQMTGTLEIRGIKKTVVLDCQGPRGPIFDDHKQDRMGFSARTKINRKDFGMDWNREVAKNVLMLGDLAEINLEIELIKVPGVKTSKH
ncbi:MAG: YceI family protein [Candidatus Obscuribacterales bacterium]|nr:YceI family protein [Candidatus Obscuribacterales bacterium]